MSTGPEEGIRTKSVKWLFEQGVNSIILIALLIAIGYWMLYEHPKVIEKSQKHYELTIEASEARYQKGLEDVTKDHQKALDMLAKRADEREALLREFLDLKRKLPEN